MLTKEEIKSQLEGQEFNAEFKVRLLSPEESILCSLMYCPDVINTCDECIGMIKEQEVRNLNPKLEPDKMVEAIEIIQLLK
jgi:hypothetical protein